MSTATDTSWIQPGVEVVVYNNSRLNPTARRDRVAKVATKSFTTEKGHKGERFPLDRPERRIGGTWGHQEYVVAADSATGRAELAKQAARNRMQRARNAVAGWERNRTRENRLAAIAALQAVDD